MVRPIIGANLTWRSLEKSMERKGDYGGRILPEKKGTARGRAFWVYKRSLFFLVFFLAFGGCGFALGLGLRFGFFHGLLSFGGFLGANFCAFFFLFVENLLAAKQFEESLVGSVAFVPVSADDSRVAAVAVAETRADRVEQLDESFIGHEVSARQTACGEVAALAQRDHF